MIKTTGKEKNYELVEYVNDVNREYTEVLMELNINGIMDTAYSYGDQRLTNERFTGWTGYYTYDPRGSVTGVADSKGMIWQSYRYNANGEITFGKPQYNNVYSYNAESYNPNIQAQYLRARYYSPETANFLTENSYLGNIADPLTLNRYNYAKSSPLNYIDPSGHDALTIAQEGLSIGGGFAALDGPFPYGDILGGTIAIGSLMVAGGVYIYDSITQAEDKSETGDCQSDETDETDVEDQKLPKVKYPGDDPSVSPGDGWEWRGPADKGSWYKPETGETLHPDLKHPEPEGPHWDYIPYKNGPQYRVNPDGTVIPK